MIPGFTLQWQIAIALLAISIYLYLEEWRWFSFALVGFVVILGVSNKTPNSQKQKKPDADDTPEAGGDLDDGDDD